MAYQSIVKTATETNLTVTISQNIGTGAVVVNGSIAGPTFTYVPDIFVVGFELHWRTLCREMLEKRCRRLHVGSA